MARDLSKYEMPKGKKRKVWNPKKKKHSPETRKKVKELEAQGHTVFVGSDGSISYIDGDTEVVLPIPVG